MITKFQTLILKSFIILMLCLVPNISTSQEFNTLNDRIAFYKNLFGEKCINDKITNNFGDGFDQLYGTRNVRTVLYGTVYRGGANNFYNKVEKRDNHNPLPDMGLKNLCNLGFDKAVYLYATNYDEAPKQIKTDKNELEYLNITGDSRKTFRKILELVKKTIDNPNDGPIYFHCWNGWHQSGLVSAVILMQFCEYSKENAYKYWEDNIDKVRLKTEKIKNTIYEFTPFEDLKISKELQNNLCPCNKNKVEND